MNRQELADELDQQLERLSGQRDFTPDKPWDSLLAIAQDLRQMPTAAFRNQLPTDLMAKAESNTTVACQNGANGCPAFAQGRYAGSGYSLQQLVGSAALAETLPMFSGKSFRLFPVDHRSFVVSFVSHTVLILLIASGIVIGTSPVTKTIDAVFAGNVSLNGSWRRWLGKAQSAGGEPRNSSAI